MNCCSTSHHKNKCKWVLLLHSILILLHTSHHHHEQYFITVLHFLVLFSVSFFCGGWFGCGCWWEQYIKQICNSLIMNCILIEETFTRASLWWGSQSTEKCIKKWIIQLVRTSPEFWGHNVKPAHTVVRHQGAYRHVLHGFISRFLPLRCCLTVHSR